jgi:hypothetical protein
MAPHPSSTCLHVGMSNCLAPLRSPLMRRLLGVRASAAGCPHRSSTQLRGNIDLRSAPARPVPSRGCVLGPISLSSSICLLMRPGCGRPIAPIRHRVRAFQPKTCPAPASPAPFTPTRIRGEEGKREASVPSRPASATSCFSPETARPQGGRAHC